MPVLDIKLRVAENHREVQRGSEPPVPRLIRTSGGAVSEDKHGVEDGDRNSCTHGRRNVASSDASKQEERQRARIEDELQPGAASCADVVVEIGMERGKWREIARKNEPEAKKVQRGG